jgi:hypothetical protein
VCYPISKPSAVDVLQQPESPARIFPGIPCQDIAWQCPGIAAPHTLLGALGKPSPSTGVCPQDMETERGGFFMSADCKQSRNTAGWSRSSLNRNVLAAKGGKIHMSALKKNGIFFHGNRFYTSICKKETRKRGFLKEIF